MTAPSTASPSAFPPSSYPIGTPGQAWGSAEQAQWRARQVRQRSYANDVLNNGNRLLPAHVMSFRSATTEKVWGSRTYYGTFGGNDFYG